MYVRGSGTYHHRDTKNETEKELKMKNSFNKHPWNSVEIVLYTIQMTNLILTREYKSSFNFNEICTVDSRTEKACSGTKENSTPSFEVLYKSFWIYIESIYCECVSLNLMSGMKRKVLTHKIPCSQPSSVLNFPIIYFKMAYRVYA